MGPRTPGRAETTPTIVGAVLTGGASRRMGTDKATYLVDGVPMAARVAGAMRSAGCSAIVFVGGDQVKLGALGERVVPDLAPGAGPAGGVVSAIGALTEMAELVVIASCDTPFLTGGQLRTLTEAIQVAGDAVDVAVARDDTVQPLCGVWRTSTLPVISAAFASGVRSVFGLLDLLRVLEVPLDARALRNVNTPVDLGTPPRHH